MQVFRNGNRFFAGTRTTDAQGDITVSTTGPEINGVGDRYTARARNLQTGEVCSGSVVLRED